MSGTSGFDHAVEYQEREQKALMDLIQMTRERDAFKARLREGAVAFGGPEYADAIIAQVEESLRRKAEPEAGSREAVAASDVDSCWWSGDERTYYLKMTPRGYVKKDTLTGKVFWHCNCRDLVAATTYTPVLDSNGQPAEPVVGSDEWARIVTRDLGKTVVTIEGMGSVLHSWDGKKWVASTGSYSLLNDRGRSGLTWRIVPAPSPILASLQAAQAAHIASLEQQLAAVAAERDEAVKRAEKEWKGRYVGLYELLASIVNHMAGEVK